MIAPLFMAWAVLAQADAGVAPSPLPIARTATRTSQVTASLSKEELELAAHLDLLADLEVLSNWELLSLLPALEEDEE